MTTPPPPPPDLTYDTLIAERYRIIRELGEGGMGRVLEVKHESLGKRFAMKIVRVDRLTAPLVERFKREAYALAHVDSPRVAQVVDFGVVDGAGPYYVMELVSGETLDRRLARAGALPPAEALPILSGLAEALGDVHEAGLVHRDVKPSNVGLPGRGPIPVKLIDFGLAAAADDGHLARLTRSHEVMGSLPYMAPEQFHGERPSPSIDLWALGVVAVELLTGQLPYRAPTPPALMHQIMTAPPPDLQDPRIPGPARAAVKALLAKEPTARGDARGAARAFANPGGGIAPIPPTAAVRSAGLPTLPSTTTHPTTPAQKPRWPLWGGAGLVLAAAVGWVVAGSGKEPARVPAPTAEPSTAAEVPAEGTAQSKHAKPEAPKPPTPADAAGAPAQAPPAGAAAAGGEPAAPTRAARRVAPRKAARGAAREPAGDPLPWQGGVLERNGEEEPAWRGGVIRERR